MVVTVYPGRLSGRMAAIASKSHAHRLLIAAALSDKKTDIICRETSEDIDATARCLGALCADITRAGDTFLVAPRPASASAQIRCGESGSTYRFLAPVACALGTKTTFLLEGRLPERPMGPLFEVMAAHGARISGQGTPAVTIDGRLTGGRYVLPGDVSSQFISGLIFAAAATGKGAQIHMTGALQSKSYIDMTLEAVRAFGIDASFLKDRIEVPGGQRYKSPGAVSVEGDWSNAALILCASAASRGDVDLTGLNPHSAQGDRAVAPLIAAFRAGGKLPDVDLTDIPDLAPALALLGVAGEGTVRFINAERLRLKESDRIGSIVETLRALGAPIRGTDREIIIRGTGRLAGGTVDARGDHRIAMMAALAAALSDAPVTIRGARAVDKSYPGFYDDIERLGLRVERAAAERGE